MTEGTPYTDDALKLRHGVGPTDVRSFVKRRTTNPYRLDEHDLVVWNYSNHEIDEDSIEEQAPDLREDEYIIPFQVTGVWGYMQDLLPSRVRKAELLIYSDGVGYKPYPNYLTRSDPRKNRDVKDYLSTRVNHLL